jgi:hypothetical protein
MRVMMMMMMMMMMLLMLMLMTMMMMMMTMTATTTTTMTMMTIKLMIIIIMTTPCPCLVSSGTVRAWCWTARPLSSRCSARCSPSPPPHRASTMMMMMIMMMMMMMMMTMVLRQFWYGAGLVLDGKATFVKMFRSLLAVTTSAQSVGENSSFFGGTTRSHLVTSVLGNTRKRDNVPSSEVQYSYILVSSTHSLSI